MPMRPVSFFTAAYAEQSLQVRKKSRILATINLIFGSVSVVFAILMAITKSVVPAFVFMGLVVFCAVVLAMLRAGKYHAASSVFLYGVFAAMFIAIKFGDHPLEVYNSYVMGTLGGFLLVVASLVADRAVQPIVIGLLNLASIEAIYWTGTFPNDKHVVTTLAIQNLSVSSIMTIIGAGVAAYLVRFTTESFGRRGARGRVGRAQLRRAQRGDGQGAGGLSTHRRGACPRAWRGPRPRSDCSARRARAYPEAWTSSTAP